MSTLTTRQQFKALVLAFNESLNERMMGLVGKGYKIQDFKPMGEKFLDEAFKLGCDERRTPKPTT